MSDRKEYFIIELSILFKVSYGTVEAAKEILVGLLKKCNREMKSPELTNVQTKVFPLVVQHMVREVVSPNHTVREQVSV